MIISKNVYTNVLSFRLVRVNGCASACQGKATVFFFFFFFGMLNDSEEKTKPQPDSVCSRILCASPVALELNKCSDTILVSVQLKRLSHLLNSGFCFGFYFIAAIQREEIQTCDRRRHTLSWMTAHSSHKSHSFTSHSSVLYAKDEDASMCVGGSASKIPLHYECL